MEYFVTCENHPYYSWQLELLIESFKNIGCQNDLLISLSHTDASMNYGSNLIAHNRINGFENIGVRRGCNQLNKIYNLLWSLQAGHIKQPLVYMQPDMVLRNPVVVEFVNLYPEFLFYPDPFFTFEQAEKEIGPFSKWLNKNYKLQWIPISDFFIINKIPIELFVFIINRAELLAMHQLMENRPIHKNTVRAAFATSFSEYIENIFCRGDYSLVSQILDGINSPVISYEKGLLPDFHKLMFSYQAPAYISFGDPIKILSELYPTPNALYISKIATKKLQNRFKEIK